MGQIGNARWPFCTEVHLRKSLEANGHRVIFWQEGDVRFRDIPQLAREAGCEVVMWTTTHDLAERGGRIRDQLRMLDALRADGIPTVGVHLDRWWGLSREHRIREQPFFSVDLLCTADGGHDEQWADAGIAHAWFPPGVFHEDLGPGTPRDEYRSDVAFVGSWEGYGHKEWEPTRMAMLDAVRSAYGDRFALWPKPGAPKVRERALTDLYASVKVVVGDSCLSGGAKAYISDRVPETIGRGAFLIHPRVEGVTDGTLYTEGEHLACYDIGDHDELLRLIDHYLTHDDDRERIRDAGMAHVAATATYRVRMEQVLDLIAVGATA